MYATSSTSCFKACPAAFCRLGAFASSTPNSISAASPWVSTQASLHLPRMPDQTENSEPSRIIGIDRLDYTKGLPQKFRAFGKLLEEYPEYRRRIVLSQFAPPTRESVEAYADIKSELEIFVGFHQRPLR